MFAKLYRGLTYVTNKILSTLLSHHSIHYCINSFKPTTLAIIILLHPCCRCNVYIIRCIHH
ncbi:uncharacterized protein YOL164W-A [Saccharomyces cerevisiae S288C]|uniref:Uncharacterized protein YOL164W-A n=1 Tax=Saccharomyces cerevisiae (strain ATCC 204508 / S288c) TaxID=559292 RepID=YO16W_YEAST|eukprot:NP_878161.1 hypothetical protein YOL164W-A [Saccharomyces cerevisiae S288C]